MIENLLLFFSHQNEKTKLMFFIGNSQTQENIPIDLGIREVQFENSQEFWSRKKLLKIPVETRSSWLIPLPWNEVLETWGTLNHCLEIDPGLRIPSPCPFLLYQHLPSSFTLIMPPPIDNLHIQASWLSKHILINQHTIFLTVNPIKCRHFSPLTIL